jgi:hypothetical protein
LNRASTLEEAQAAVVRVCSLTEDQKMKLAEYNARRGQGINLDLLFFFPLIFLHLSGESPESLEREVNKLKKSHRGAQKEAEKTREELKKQRQFYEDQMKSLETEAERLRQQTQQADALHQVTC